MNKKEYYKRIERINDKFKIDRVSADEEYQLVSQRNYLSTKYIEHLEQQCKKQKEAIEKAINDLSIILEIVREQPLGSDCWIIDRLEANKKILKEVSE